MAVLDRTLQFTVNLDWSTVNWVKQQRYVLIAQNIWRADEKSDQLYTVSMSGKRSQANQTEDLSDTLGHVYTIAHWSGPRPYVDFSQDRQGRLVHVRTVIAATCIKI